MTINQLHFEALMAEVVAIRRAVADSPPCQPAPFTLEARLARLERLADFLLKNSPGCERLTLEDFEK